MIEIVIGTHLWIRGCDPHLFRLMRDENTFPNPEWHKKKAMGFWIGSTPSKLELWRARGTWLELPRGYLHELKGHLDGKMFQVKDRTVAPMMGAVPQVRGTLDGYQQEGAEKMLQVRQGVLESPTGSGKTAIMVSMIPRLGVKTLIVVHSRELLAQTQKVVEKWLEIEPGNWGGGRKKKLRDVTVATVQTIIEQGVTEEEAKGFGCLMVDECHHAPARTWTEVCGRFEARHRYGFTATSFRKDGLTFMLWRVMGPLVWKIERKDVLKAGRVVKVKTVKVPTGWNYRMTEGTREWGTMLNALAVDPGRNKLVVEEIDKWAQVGRVIVLTDRISQAEELSKMLGDRAVMVHGQIKTRERRERMEQVRAGARITVGTLQLFGEGIDVPGWDILVMASPVCWGTRDKQAVGRVMRASEGKSGAVVVKFKDEIEWPEEATEDDKIEVPE